MYERRKVRMIDLLEEEIWWPSYHGTNGLCHMVDTELNSDDIRKIQSLCATTKYTKEFILQLLIRLGLEQLMPDIVKIERRLRKP